MLIFCPSYLISTVTNMLRGSSYAEATTKITASSLPAIVRSLKKYKFYINVNLSIIKQPFSKTPYVQLCYRLTFANAQWNVFCHFFVSFYYPSSRHTMDKITTFCPKIQKDFCPLNQQKYDSDTQHFYTHIIILKSFKHLQSKSTFLVQ